MKTSINYSLEELLPIVESLSIKYTRNESSSITYETAEQLMDAVIYCIMELSPENGIKEGAGALISAQYTPRNATEAYEAGYQAVLAKVKAALHIYEGIMGDFRDYGSLAYRETIEKGMPAFFNYYDPLFAPQETLLTLDYPTLKPLGAACGIDLLYEYLLEIQREQRTLSAFPEEMVREALRNYHFLGGELFINVQEVFLGMGEFARN